MNDYFGIKLRKLQLHIKSLLTDIRFWLILHNPCYTSVWLNKVYAKLLIAKECICCTVTRTLTVGILIGFLIGRFV